MKNVSHKKTWNLGMTQAHVEPSPTPLIKIKQDDKLDNYFVKINFHGDPTSDMLDLYELMMALFENGKPEEFLLSLKKFNITLAASRTLETGAKN